MTVKDSPEFCYKRPVGTLILNDLRIC